MHDALTILLSAIITALIAFDVAVVYLWYLPMRKQVTAINTHNTKMTEWVYLIQLQSNKHEEILGSAMRMSTQDQLERNPCDFQPPSE